MKKKLKLIIDRLKMAYRILTSKKQSFIVIDINHDNLVNLITDKEVEFNLSYFRFHPYLAFKMIKWVASYRDDLDMILEKAAFRAEAEIMQQSKNGKL